MSEGMSYAAEIQLRPNMRIHSIHRLLRREDGAMSILMLFFVVIMLMAGGLAVDTMRVERERALLQATLDRATLAAADVEHDREPEAIVRDHLEAAGLGRALGPNAVDVSDISANHRVVSADATLEFGTMLLHLAGVERMGVAAHSTAREGVDVEIVLVLDISGTMSLDSDGVMRIDRLRTAAKTFVDTVLRDTRAKRTTVSIVPYSGQVNPGRTFFEAMHGAGGHTESSCLDLEASDFAHTRMPETSREQVEHFRMYPMWLYGGDEDAVDWGWCPADASAIHPPDNRASVLRAHIDGLRLFDGTGTHIGMKYALAMLDPGTRDEIAGMAAHAPAPQILDHRPLAWGAPDARKVIVLMTDGDIRAQFAPARTGVRDDDENDVDDEQYQRHGAEGWRDDPDDQDGTDHDLLNSQVALYEQEAGSDEVSSIADNVAAFLAQCATARDLGVTVYTIAFDATSDATGQMRACATSPDAHYYDVDGLEIASAFNDIAGQIAQLRLTR